MKDWITLKTKTFRLIYDVLERAHINSSMHLIIAPPGCGKTFTLQYYKRKVSNVYYFKIDKIYSPKDFYLEILSVLGAPDYDRKASLKSMANRVAFLLNEGSAKSLLVFDEIGKFTADMLEYIQSIRDSTDTHVGIVLAGPSKFEVDMNYWIAKNYRGIPELNSRIYSREYATPPSNEEKYQIVKRNGVTEPSEMKRICKESSDLRMLYQNVIEYRYKKQKSKGTEVLELEPV
jgi:DNA transposition AAA+ family ATPase